MKDLTPKKVNAIFILAILIGALIGFLGAYLEYTVLVFVGMAIMCMAVVLRVIFYRCPHCGKYLDRSTGQYCPYCGRDING